MSLPELADWTDTRIGLHQASQVIGGVRRAVASPEPNWAHLGLRISPKGVTTSALTGVGTLTLDFPATSTLYQPEGGGPAQSIPLAGQTQISLANAVESMLHAAGHPVALDRSKITANTPLKVNESTAADYAIVLNRIGSVLAEFRESLPGEKSPLLVWPHGFDASFLWFATHDASEQAPHLSFGFSPGSEGFDRPYLYFYAYPIPEGMLSISLPAPARWYEGSWTGMVIDYDSISGEERPEEVILVALESVYQAVAPKLKHPSNS